MYNALSLLLGLLSWLIPILLLGRYVKEKTVNGRWIPVGFSACAAALLFQLAEFCHRVTLSDWSGLADTAGVSLKAAVILLVLAVPLNTLALCAANQAKGKKPAEQ